MAMSEPAVAQNVASPLAHSRRARFWLRELPYIAALTLTILGVAYTSVSQQPLIGYWEFLAVAIGLVCVTTGFTTPKLDCGWFGRKHSIGWLSWLR
jgi:hypothetical protein